MLINEIENGKLKGRNDYYKSIILDRDPDESFLERKTRIQPNIQEYNVSKVSQKYTGSKGRKYGYQN